MANDSDDDDQFYGEEEEEHVVITLDECGNCGRKFNVDVLGRHQKICTKVKKRKAFDSSKQRLEGIEKLPIKKSSQQTVNKPIKKKADWRSKHEEFIKTIRSARGVTAAIKEGRDLPPPPPPTINPDYVQCPHCDRRFNESAAERHINFCKEQKSRLPKSSSKLKTESRLKKQEIRTKYRPPAPGGKKKSISSPVKPRQPAQQQIEEEVDSPPSSNTRLSKQQQQQSPNVAWRDNNNKPRSGKNRNGDPKWFEDLKRADSGKHRRIPSSNSKISSDELEDSESPSRTPSGRDRSIKNVGVVRPSSRDQNVMRDEAKMNSAGRRKLANFCHDCGTKYPVTSAKFCCECGIRRMAIT